MIWYVQHPHAICKAFFALLPLRSDPHGAYYAPSLEQETNLDTEWFEARAELLGITQDDIAEKLHLDRTTVSRIKNGKRPLTLAEVETLASVLQVPPLEIIARAHKWRTPIRTQTEVRGDLLEIAYKIALDVLIPGTHTIDPNVARHAAAIYGLLHEYEEQGHKVTSNDNALRLITDTIRRILAATSKTPPQH